MNECGQDRITSKEWGGNMFKIAFELTADQHVETFKCGLFIFVVVVVVVGKLLKRGTVGTFC